MSRENEMELTNEIIGTLDYSDIIAITIAEGGAMGEPGGLELVKSDLSLYHTNLSYSDINTDKLFEKIPVLGKIKVFFGNANNVEDWKTFYMGFGNYLLVRDKYFEPYQKYLDENYKEGYEFVELYNSWYEILKQIIE